MGAVESAMDPVSAADWICANGAKKINPKETGIAVLLAGLWLDSYNGHTDPDSRPVFNHIQRTFFRIF